MIDTAAPTESKRRSSRNPRWDYARYSGGHSRVIRSRNLNLQLYAEAFMWFHKIAAFRSAESHLLYGKRPTKQLRSEHRTIILNLIAEGREIVRRIHADGGLIKPANGFSLQDVQSAIEELQNTDLQWNGSMSKSRREEILKNVFNAP